MSTWSGWENEFLLAARIINTPPNRNFLSEWASHTNSPNCKRNPIDLHAVVGPSSNCVKPAGFTWWTQNYATHANAATAFSRQVNAAQFGAILDTLGTGNPFQDPGYKNVAAALRKWGSTNFATWYVNHIEGGTGTGTSGSPGVHKGWNDLRGSLGKRKLGDKIRAANSMDAATLRQIAKAHKVLR